MTLPISRSFATAIAVAGLASVALAGVETVEIQKVQVVRTVSGTVSDPGGVPLAGAIVAELGADGKTVVRSIQTDKSGHFSLSRRSHQKIYSLKISMDGFNPLIVHVRTSVWGKKVLKLQLEIST